MTDLMQQTRGTAADWGTADPVLEAGQLGYVTDTGDVYMGDGVTVWSALTPINAAPGGGGSGGDPVDDPAEWGADLGFDAEFNGTGSTPPSGWGWVNQGTATYLEAKGRGLITEPTAGAGNTLRLLDRAIPSASSWEAVFKLRGRMYPFAGTYGSFCHLRDSVGGKVVTFGPGGTPSIDLWNWNSTTSLNGVVDALTTDAMMSVDYWKIRKNSATSWDFQISADGVVWDTIRLAHNVATFLGTAPTHIGFGLWRNNVTLSTACDWFRVR